MIEILRTIEQLFQDHAPETLMALFGALTSIGLFYLIGSVLRQMFGLQHRSADWEASQDRATAALVEALVSALVTEAGHLRATLDRILEEAMNRSEQNTRLLNALATQTEESPEKTLELLRPEFDHLRHELRQAETRIMAKIALCSTEAERDGLGEPSEHKIAGEQHQQNARSSQGE